MSDEITFFVPGRPFSKKRPRFGKGFTYSDPETEACEYAVRHYAKRAFGNAQPFTGPISLVCRFVFAKARTSKATGTWHTYKIDADNALKGILDALNPLSPKRRPDGWSSAWLDDAQVCMISVTKTWATEIDVEGTTVTVMEMPG